MKKISNSKKYTAMWIAEIIATVFAIIALYHMNGKPADYSAAWLTIFKGWGYFTGVNLFGYHAANVVRHGQAEGWNATGAPTSLNNKPKENIPDINQ